MHTVTTSPARTVAAELVAALNAHDLDRFAAAFAPGAECWEVTGCGLAEHLHGFPDLVLTVEDVIADGDAVAFTWTVEGTHRGTWLNIPATRRRVAAHGTTVLRVADGAVCESRWTWDVAGLLRGLGLLPALRPSTDGHLSTGR